MSDSDMPGVARSGVDRMGREVFIQPHGMPFLEWQRTLDRPAVPVAAMSQAQYLDFVGSMHVLTGECELLANVAFGSMDAAGAGWVLHGPWVPADCGAIFREWLDAGLVSVRRLQMQGAADIELPVAESRALLADPGSWDSPEANGVFVTSAGCRFAGWEEWYSALERVPKW